MSKNCDICGHSTNHGQLVGDLFACPICINAIGGLPREPIPKKSFAARVGTSSGGDKKPTQEQQDGIDLALAGHKVLVMEAGAGTGKTTFLRMLADSMPGNGQYTAFNTALVKESERKFADTKVAANTTHSLAFRAVGKTYSHRLGGSRMRSDQLAKMLGVKELSVDLGDGKSKRLAPGFLASRVMDSIRRYCQSADKEIECSHFKYVDGIDVPTEDGSRTYSNNERLRKFLLPFARKAWADICDPNGQLPFTHNHYVKIWQLNDPVVAADYILLDESQDTAPVMLDILRQQKCQVILVGDSAQQIYEWRGAVNAMASFPDAPRGFLSQSFRFGPAIAEVANAVLETLEEQTPLRLKGLESITSSVGVVDDPLAILCRTNAVAVSKLLNAIGEDKHPFLVGGGADVIAFVEAAKKLQCKEPTSHPDLACFSSWTEVQEYVSMDEGDDLKLMVKLIDKFGVDQILSALKAMPEEKNADLVISTAHKAKGREWDSVLLANDFPTKSRCSDADRKLLYVAVTRARLQLDLSECPFFTGNDSVNVDNIIAAHPRMEQSIISPTPSEEPGEFTWAKDMVTGSWLVRGPTGFSNRMVVVIRKDGSETRILLGEVVSEFSDVAKYRVK